MTLVNKYIGSLKGRKRERERDMNIISSSFESGEIDVLEISTMLMNWLLEYCTAIYLYFSLKRLAQAILNNFFHNKGAIILLSNCLIKLNFGHLNMPFEF